MRHLEMIQGVINRMASNSFLIKGWTVTLVAALFALAAKDSNQQFAAIAYGVIPLFWGLDGFFLWQERLFRALHEHVRQKLTIPADFSMNAGAFNKGWRRSWLGSTLSPTLYVFYGASLLAVFLVMYIM